MPRWVRLAFWSVVVGCLILACGSRTGLSVPEPGCAENEVDCEPAKDARAEDQSGDETLPPPPPVDGRADHPADAPLFEGGKLDVVTDCGQPAYCDPRDPGFIYQCGVRIEQCSSLEQCEQVGGEAGKAMCVNPCLDTLGQDTSNGCEFYAAEMDVTDETAGVCYAVYIVNQWKTGEPAKIQVERAGVVLDVGSFARIPVGTGLGIQYAPFDARNGLPKDEIAILFLSRDPNVAGGGTNPNQLASCPPGVVPAILGDAALHGTGKGTAFRIKTNVPVVAYQILPYGGGRARVTGATLLLPTNVWDTNYLAINAAPEPDFGGSPEPRAGPTMVVIASEDATNVAINPVRPIVGGGGLSGGPANVTQTYSLNRGEYLQFTQPGELTGSPIVASKPVAVIGGSTLMQVPVGRRRADTSEQMIAPVQALGSEYVAVRFRARRNRGDEAVPWRIVGAVNGTVLTYEPSRPAGAPPEINAREVAQFEAAGPFVVRSQDSEHPFYMAEYMTGGDIPPFTNAQGSDETPDDGEGDPEFVNVIPPTQFLPRYTLFTDPTYPETNLVVVRVKDATLGAFPDVALDCSGTLGGWADVGTSGTYQYTRVDLSTGNWTGVGGCDNGVHTIQGLFPGVDSGVPVPKFGVAVWGWGNTITLAAPNDSDPRSTRWVSYGYPAGANFTKLNSVFLPAN